MQVIIVSVFLFGVIVGVLLMKIRSSGTLRIDSSNPDKDIYRLEIDDLDGLSTKRQIVLDVDHHANLSQR